MYFSFGLFIATTMPAQPDTVFRAMEPIHLGYAAADATLYLRIALNAGGDELPLELEHRLQSDCHGRCRSGWGIPQLEASLVPADAATMRLLLPGGGAITFASVACKSRQFVAIADGVRARAVGNREIEIEAGDRYYRFSAGRLASIETAGRRLAVKANGARIESVTGPEGLLLRAQYAAAGQIAALYFGRTVAKFEYGNSGLLTHVVSEKGSEIAAMEYAGNLLVRYRLQHGSWVPVEWMANPRHRHGLPWLLEAPCLVARVGQSRYDVERTKTAIAIRQFTGGRPAGALGVNFWTKTLSWQESEVPTPTAH